VGTFEFEGTPGHVSLETVTLEEIGGRAKATSRSAFQTVEDRGGMLKTDMEEGVDETMDRLARLLKELKAERRAAEKRRPTGRIDLRDGQEDNRSRG